MALPAAYCGIPVIFDRVSRFLLARRVARLNVLAITIDDGPGAQLTPAVLAVLARHRARATFFPLGRNVDAGGDLLRQVAAQGHEICSHGYDHANHWKVTPWRAVVDIRRGWRAIDRALGVAGGVYPFRPPKGKLNLVSLVYLLWKRAPVVYWTADSGDTWTGGVPRDTEKVAALLEADGGVVVLYHDFDRRDPSTQRFVIDSLETTLGAAEMLGIATVTIGKLFGLSVS